MARILVLADSGFGKTTSIAHIDLPEKKINIKGLNPATTYIISTTTKPLPWPKSAGQYPIAPTEAGKLHLGRRVICKTPEETELILKDIVNAPDDKVANVILDDFNYLMQDWYMANALRTGWDAPKSIGFKMGKVFDAIELFQHTKKNIIVLAHGEEVKKPDNRIYFKLKTTGKMVDEYVTPEGKFDITLVGRSHYDTKEKKVVKEYVTNEDEFYASPKSPLGMFDKLYIPNDLGIVVDAVKEYYFGE